MDSLKTLLYFSIFNYPLKKEEIYAFSSIEDSTLLDDELLGLLERKVIYKIDDFYLCEAKESIVNRRKIGNKNAKEIFKKAEKTSKFISKFPFVEGVGISGSLSKGYYDTDSDIDFFIITAPKKLWIARMLLVLYKKIFLLNAIDFFCVNYYITSTNLEIEEKNRFTATELATLIPMCGSEVFASFYESNTWVYNYFGNFKQKKEKLFDVEKPFITKIVEASLNNRLGAFVEKVFMKITYKVKQYKFRNLHKETFDLAIKSTVDVSKHHPRNFQKTVIELLNKKYIDIKIKHAIILKPEHD